MRFKFQRISVQEKTNLMDECKNSNFLEDALENYIDKALIQTKLSNNQGYFHIFYSNFSYTQKAYAERIAAVDRKNHLTLEKILVFSIFL